MKGLMQFRRLFIANCFIGLLGTLFVTWYLCFYITSPVKDTKNKASFEAMIDNNNIDASAQQASAADSNDEIDADEASVDVKKEIEEFSFDSEEEALLEILFDKKFVSNEGRVFIFHKDGSFEGFFDSSNTYVTGYKYTIASGDGGTKALRISDPTYKYYISYQLSLDYDQLDLYYKKGDFHMRFDLN